MAIRRPPKGDLDRIGPFHPYLVYAAILAIDLVGLLLVLAVLTWAGDRVEDLIWPGGSEWIDF
jgi:hypothetical protein